jgi:hypothetical protein
VEAKRKEKKGEEKGRMKVQKRREEEQAGWKKGRMDEISPSNYFLLLKR